MKRNTKKWLSCLLALVVAIGILPVNAITAKAATQITSMSCTMALPTDGMTRNNYEYDEYGGNSGMLTSDALEQYSLTAFSFYHGAYSSFEELYAAEEEAAAAENSLSMDGDDIFEAGKSYTVYIKAKTKLTTLTFATNPVITVNGQNAFRDGSGIGVEGSYRNIWFYYSFTVPKQTTLTAYITGIDDIGTVYLDGLVSNREVHQIADITSSAATSTIPGLSREAYEFTKVAEGKYQIVLYGECAEEKYAPLAIVVTNASDPSTKKFYNFDIGLQEGSSDMEKEQAQAFNNNDNLYFPISVSTPQDEGGWYSLVDPTLITADEVIAAIDNIGTVKYTDGCLAKIENAETLKDYFITFAGGDEADITNLATLTEARSTYEALKSGDPIKYNLQIGGVDVTSHNLVIDSSDTDKITSGSFSFDPDTYTLTLNSVTATGDLGNDFIYYPGTEGEDHKLTIDVKGTNNLTSGHAGFGDIIRTYKDTEITSNCGGKLYIFGDPLTMGIYFRSCNLVLSGDLKLTCDITQTEHARGIVNDSTGNLTVRDDVELKIDTTVSDDAFSLTEDRLSAGNRLLKKYGDMILIQNIIMWKSISRFFEKNCSF